MAITSAALQAEFGTNPMNEQVVAEVPPYGEAAQHWLVSGGVTYRGRVMLVDTTASDNAATQKATIQALLNHV
ncbi:MAG: hypothetical protein VW577_04160 [Pelagibacteraceae bacterium]